MEALIGLINVGLVLYIQIKYKSLKTWEFVIGALFFPFGLYLAYKFLVKGELKGPSSNNTESNLKSDLGNVSFSSTELESEYSNFFIPTANTSIEELRKNLEKGVFIPVDKLFELPEFKSSTMNTLYNNKLSKGAMKNSYSRNLILKNESLMVLNNKATVGGKLSSVFGSGENEVFYDQITAVKFKDCNKVHNGYINFLFPGKQDYGSGIGALASQQDPYNVYFFESLNPLMRNVKQLVQELSRKKDDSVPVSVDVTLQIEKLHELKEKGVITESEFEEKKKSLMDKL